METKNLTERLRYYGGEKLKENQIRISPSSIQLLSDNEEVWYRRNILKESSLRTSTAMRLGTLTHYLCECYLTGEEEPSEGDIIQWLEDSQEDDMWRVLEQSSQMSKAFKDSYPREWVSKSESEVWVEYEPTDGVIFSGTADIIVGDTVIDIKTSTKKKSSIGDYRYQLLLLAWILNKNGRDITKMGIINLVPATKTLPARYTYIEEEINQDEMKSFIQWLKLKYKKVLLAKEYGDDWEVVMSKNLLSFRVG